MPVLEHAYIQAARSLLFSTRQLTREQEEIATKAAQCHHLRAAVLFIEELQQAGAWLEDLLGSTTVSDVVEALRYFVTVRVQKGRSAGVSDVCGMLATMVEIIVFDLPNLTRLYHPGWGFLSGPPVAPHAPPSPDKQPRAQACHFNLPGALEAIKKSLTLIWRTEAQIETAIKRAFVQVSRGRREKEGR